MKQLIINKEFPEGIIKEVEEQVVEIIPTAEDEIAELRQKVEEIKKLFTPLLKLIGGND